jgi:hypothetical protein
MKLLPLHIFMRYGIVNLVVLSWVLQPLDKCHDSGEKHSRGFACF